MVEVLKLMYGSETISSLGPKIWGILTTELKWIVSPTLFKKKIPGWVPENFHRYNQFCFDNPVCKQLPTILKVSCLSHLTIIWVGGNFIPLVVFP